MLSELRRGLPDVRALTGRAEAIPLIPAREREATRERIRAFVACRPETAAGEFTVPVLTGLLRVRRL